MLILVVIGLEPGAKQGTHVNLKPGTELELDVRLNTYTLHPFAVLLIGLEPNVEPGANVILKPSENKARSSTEAD